MSRSSTPRPPTVDSTLEAGLVDVPRLTWWSQRGFCHGARHGRGVARVASGFLALMWWPVSPLLLILQAFLVFRRSSRCYLTQERDAALTIVANSDGWHVTDHIAVRPGTGRGRALRALVEPELLAAADAAGIPIHATAANHRLAAAYMAELPGLVDVGRGRPRGRELLRMPQK